MWRTVLVVGLILSGCVGRDRVGNDQDEDPEHCKAVLEDVSRAVGCDETPTFERAQELCITACQGDVVSCQVGSGEQFGHCPEPCETFWNAECDNLVAE